MLSISQKQKDESKSQGSVETSDLTKSVDTPNLTKSDIGTMLNKSETILVVGYSPTGGGHTGRSLDIVQEALNEGSLKDGDTVILHVPSKWNGKERPDSLEVLAKQLKDKNINVIVAAATKSVQGFLREDGTSDDPRILTDFANSPLRDTSAYITGLEDAKHLESNFKDEFKDVKTIEAKDLMQSISNAIGADKMKTHVRVLTDMDHTLQKAASNHEVPSEHRLDQQNHAVMLEMNDSDLKKENAVLSKVLGGNREMVAHIDLGGKNTLLGVQESINGSNSKFSNKNKIDVNMSKKAAMEEMAARLMDEKNDLRKVGKDQQYQGVFYKDGLKPENVKNIMYVYAHNYQNGIAESIIKGVNEGKKGFEDTLFVFCGGDTLKKREGEEKAPNAMHLAYAVEADAITTMGAGTAGEFVYLHEKGGSKAGLMMFPIKGHNEQEKNADVLEGKDSVKDYLARYADGDDMESKIYAYVADRREKAEVKYGGDENLSKMFNAVNNKDTYVSAGHKLLFNKDGSESLRNNEIEGKELEMRESPLLRANRKFVKTLFQAIHQIKEEGKNGTVGEFEKINLRISMGKKEGETKLTVAQLRDKLDSIGGIMDVINKKNREDIYPEEGADIVLSRSLKRSDDKKKRIEEEVTNPDDFILLGEAKEFLDRIISAKSAADASAALRDMEEKFGHTVITGF
ncbi:type 1 periplasmic-binding domain-containing protein [Janthinobacterium violaceinigrum]|uniref:Uncharacterized protein n=1 Tax=Janthinobacterium violaceinigrum TaxID=2654252 RepID=A0A6I1I5I9_9BURK|nr:hypothetical protein [Janthinobacterium violaceinigrum]KAB8065250.1 hypothetical protein GCN75_09625 [Janthinobacterium violaceinigrum]